MVKTIIVNASLSITSILSFLFLAEIVTRIIAPQGGLTKSRWLYENNEILGYSMRPNFNLIHKDRYRKYIVTTNSRGLRSPEYPYKKDRGVYRIIILGDSFTFGHGVEDNETFSYYLCEYLYNGRKNFEVVNAGVNGYGTWEELEWLKSEGYKYEPDLVITAFCGDNDALDNYMAIEAKKYGKFRREVVDGWLAEVEFTGRKLNEKVQERYINPIWGFIIAHSHLRELIVRRIFQFKVRYGLKPRSEHLPGHFSWFNVLRKDYTNVEELSIIRTKVILSKTSDFIKSIGAQYLIISIPLPETVDKRLFDTTINELQLEKDNFDINKPDKILENFCTNNEIPFIKLSEYLESSMYYPLNRHFNPLGNKKVARILADYVKLSRP